MAIRINGDPVTVEHENGELVGASFLEQAAGHIAALLSATIHIEDTDPPPGDLLTADSRMAFAEALGVDHFEGADFELEFEQGTNWLDIRYSVDGETDFGNPATPFAFRIQQLDL